MSASFATQALDRSHDRAGFSCGNGILDRHLKESAFQDIKRNFVALASQSRVVAYDTLAATSVDLRELPEEVTRRLPAYSLIPAILPGRLAVDLSCRGQGLGRAMVVDALIRVSVLGIGAFGLTVDPEDADVAMFYERAGFVKLAGSHRLVLPFATARKTGLFD